MKMECRLSESSEPEQIIMVDVKPMNASSLFQEIFSALCIRYNNSTNQLAE